ncbi:MAG: TlpA disulfide reductase family protein [Myxococcota bacterium]
MKPLVVGAFLALGCAHGPASLPAGPHPYTALRLPATRGGAFSPTQLRGKVVLVAFLASWCFPCLADLTVLGQLQERHAARGFTVVAVGMDLEGERVLAPFTEQYAPAFPVLIADPRLREGKSPFGPIRALPTYFLFDRQGQGVLAYQGVAAPKDLLRVVQEVVER